MLEKREAIIGKLRKKGCRMTKQREIILDVILRGECTSCKEIYYQAAKEDSAIGMATVYRMVNVLEENGIIDRTRIYQIREDS